MSRKITLLVVHCSATTAAMDIGVDWLRKLHTTPKPRGNGWADVGYHHVVRRDGRREVGRAEQRAGAHVIGHNANSIGICLVGGIKPGGAAETNFTDPQYDALEQLLRELKVRYPNARICGHRDLSPDRNGDGKVTPGEWVKDCPTFDVAAWWTARTGLAA